MTDSIGEPPVTVHPGDGHISPSDSHVAPPDRHAAAEGTTGATGTGGGDADAPGAAGVGTGEVGSGDDVAGEGGAPRPSGARRRRGSRGGRGRGPRPAGHAAGEESDGSAGDDEDTGTEDTGTEDTGTEDTGTEDTGTEDASDEGSAESGAERAAPVRRSAPRVVQAGEPEELPDRPIEGKIQSTEIAERALVRRPQIGDTRPSIGDTRPGPAATVAPPAEPVAAGGRARGANGPKAGGSKTAAPRSNEPKVAPAARAAGADAAPATDGGVDEATGRSDDGDGKAKKRRRGGKGRGTGGVKVVEAVTKSAPVAIDDATRESRRGRERNGKPVGRYLMCVHVSERFTQIAVLEGRNLIEHYVSRPADDVNQIHGNVYLGKVTNVLPGMEAAFVDIGTPKNAVLYRGDVQYESEDIIERGQDVRIEQMLRNKQTILTQVTKNPIGVKGARLTQEVSLPGRFVVLVPNSKTYGISKRLPDDERKRLRAILDKVKPAQHGVIVRTAAEGVTSEELRRDVQRLLDQWTQIEELAARSQAPKLIYREPSLAVRVIREEFNKDYRGVIIDDRALYEDVRGYVESLNPELADRIRYYDPEAEGLPLFESERVHEQVHKALDRKVWLPSGGSLIIEHTEALTVIDVNTGRNVGSSSLEETVYRNNLEAAEEIARQLRLRDIGGIIVIDFIDMEIRENRRRVIDVFRDALARDKTRTQVFDISDLGLVEMTRKRIGEGLLTAFADHCEVCEGRGVVVHHDRI